MNGDSALGDGSEFAPRKIVCRKSPRSEAENLRLAEEMAAFIRKFEGKLSIGVADFFPTRPIAPEENG